MKIRHLVLIAIIFQSFIFTTKAQVYLTQTGETSFFSETPMENISGLNKTVAAAMNLASNDIAIRIQNVAFKFPNKLMEEHFNENYMESDKFPISTFKGKIIEKIDFTKDGTYEVSANGTFDIHGVKQERVLKGKLTVAKNQLTLQCNFDIKLADYKIEIPTLVIAKIAETIAVKSKFVLIPKNM